MYDSPTVIRIVFRWIGTIKEFTIEQLNANDGKYELKQQINDQNIHNIFQWANNAIENGLQFRDSFDGFQRS